MSPDYEKYRPYVAHFDLSDAEKDELIHSVWLIMESFVDRAFGIDRDWHIRPACANNDSPAAEPGVDSAASECQKRAAHAAQQTNGRRPDEDDE